MNSAFIYAFNKSVVDVRVDVAEAADGAEGAAAYQAGTHLDFEIADRAFYKAVVAEIKRRRGPKLFKKWRQKESEAEEEEEEEEEKEAALVMLRSGIYVPLEVFDTGGFST